ncbi:unnamed protein product [Agarophyton chilense]
MSCRPSSTLRRNPQRVSVLLACEGRRREYVVAHQQEALKSYVRLALEKAVHWHLAQVKLNTPLDRNDEDLVQEWLKPIYRERKRKPRLTRKESEELLITKALEALRPRRTKPPAPTLSLYARLMLIIIPELPKLCRMLLKASKFRIKQVKYGEFETARAMVWYAYGAKMPSPDILSRTYDLVEFESGRMQQSRPRKQLSDPRILRNGKRVNSMDEILAMSLVELTDRTMYCLADTAKPCMLYSDKNTAVCPLYEFVAEISRCAVHLNPALLELVKQCMDKKMYRNRLLFRLERNWDVVSLLWGEAPRLKEWYERVILVQRQGLINSLFGMMHSDYGQFEILGLRYTFGRGKFADQHMDAMPPYRIAAMELDREYLKKDSNFKKSVYMRNGVLVKKEPRNQVVVRAFILVVYAIVMVVLTVVLCVKGVNDGIVGYLEVVSLVTLGTIGTLVSIWQCLSSQSRPIRRAFQGCKEVHGIEDLLSVSYMRVFANKKKKEEQLEVFRKWLAGNGYGENLPGIEVFFSGKDRYPLYDPKGIRVDHLSHVTLCDGYYLVRRPDEKARLLMRHGDNLRVEDICDAHAVMVSVSRRCTMRVGGD